VRNLLARIAGWAVEHPTPMVTIAVLLALICSVAALGLDADASPSTLVDTGSGTYAATQRFHQEFGDEPVEILVKEDLRRLLLTPDLGRLLALEGCLAGKAPGGHVFKGKPAPAPCAKIAALEPSFVVYGPATFLNQFALQAQGLLRRQLQATVVQARAAAQAAQRHALAQGQSAAEARLAGRSAGLQVLARFERQLLQLGTQYGISGVPQITDPQYVQSVVFDNRFTGGVPKARFAYLFPSPDSALITVRLRPDLTDQQRSEAISLFRQAVADPAFKLKGGSYVVSGVPVVLDGLAGELSTQILILLAVALVVMAITLALVFRPPLRLLPLALACAAGSITFGLLALVGGSLTMASIAVLPILIGLAVDYAIQFQARFGERRAAGSGPPRAALEAAAAGGPVIATAGLATAAGFCVLLLSPIPMIRGFGVLLVAGIAIAFAVALTAGIAALSLVPGARAARRPGEGGGMGRARRAAARLGVARRKLGGGAGRLGTRALALSVAAPGRVLAVAAVLAASGWVAGTQIGVISDIRELVPRNLPELHDVDELQSATGVSGEVDVAVTAPDLTDPKVIEWMKGFETRVLAAHGFGGQYPSCRAAQTQICPAISLPDLFGEGGVPSQRHIRALIRLLPPYFSQAVIARDPKTGKPGNTAVIAFGIKVMPFDQQKRLIDDIRAQVNPPGTANDPPPGVTAQVVGLPVLAADANSALSDNRYLMTAAGLLAVALALLACYRSLRRAVIPLVPIVLATGWSSLVLWIAGIPLNPMSATLGALVIAIATEFSVLISARYHEERAAGGSVGEALRRAYARTGAAVAASGATAIAGFAVLVATDIRMLRDFGLVTVFDLAVALAGVMMVLPAALVFAEGRSGRLPVLSRLRRRRAAVDAAA